MLNDYDWENQEETDRKHQDRSPDPSDPRSPYEHDRARIIHSIAFRCLQGKTQIFAPGKAEFLRTRVTHSIEVAQIGRSLAMLFGIPESLVEAACLAHDLGHPPFGHTGEIVLNSLMRSHGGFEGNAQTFRIVTRLEEKSRAYPGLNLTRATLLGTLKYPYCHHPDADKFLYDDDSEAYETWLFQGTPYRLLDAKERQPSDRIPRTIVCQLMDWADDIAYSIHDMEDGLQSGFLLPSMPLEKIADWVWRRVTIQYQTVPDGLRRDRVFEILQELRDRLEDPHSTIREVTRHYINRFVTQAKVSAIGKGKTLFDYRLEIPELVRQECLIFKMLTLEFIILDERTTTLAYRNQEILTRLFTILLENTQPSAGIFRFEMFPRNMRLLLETLREQNHLYPRLICDRLSAMTDGQAIRLYNRLCESSGSSPFEPI